MIVTKSFRLNVVGVLDTPLCINVDVILIIRSFIFLKYILIHKKLLVSILLFITANLL